MVKIISVNPQAEKLKKEFSLSYLKSSFAELDSFSKLMGVTFLLLLTITPILVYNNVLYVTQPNASALFEMVNPIDQTVILKNSQIMLQVKSYNSSIKKVSFFVQGKQICSISSYPYVCLWNVPNFAHTKYVVEAKAYDKSDNVISNQVITLTTGN